MDLAIDPAPALSKSSPTALLPIHSHQDFSRFYDHYAPLLYGLLLRQTTDTALAAAILAEVFQTLWAGRTTFNQHQARATKPQPISWLLGIAHRNERFPQAVKINGRGIVDQPGSGEPESDAGSADWLATKSAHCP